MKLDSVRSFKAQVSAEVVASADFQYRQLAVDSTLLAYAASVTFEEVLNRRVASEDLRHQVS